MLQTTLPYATIIVLLAILQLLYFATAVGRARGRHGVEAPAVSGDEHFERFHRAHQNTLEQIVIFIPAIFASAVYGSFWATLIAGVAYLVGRMWYFRNYIKEPSSRGGGMLLTVAASIALIVSGLIGAIRFIFLTTT